jgi:arylsulfatase A
MRRFLMAPAVVGFSVLLWSTLACSSGTSTGGGGGDGGEAGIGGTRAGQTGSGGSGNTTSTGQGGAGGNPSDAPSAGQSGVDGSAQGGAGGTTIDGRGSDNAPDVALASRPNVIIVLTDDQGYGDVGCYGARGLVTPSLDRLASEGIQFTQFYSGGNVCSPSRAALMTGSYSVRVGMSYVLSPFSGVGLNLHEVTIAEMLKSRDYATMAVGKWHLGDDRTFLPTRQGFDHYFGLPYSNDMSPLPLFEDEEVIEYSPDLSQLTRRYTEKAIDFITKNRQSPFFLYLAHTMPHVPLAASADFEGLSQRGPFGDVIMEVDWSVGRILDTLDQLGIANNTLVAFTSDNGPWLLFGDYGGSAGPLREGKGTSFEGGQRVPGIVRWPDRIKGKTVSREVITSMDLLPTLAEITQAALPAWEIDGRSILPILEGRPETATARDALFFYNGTELQAVRSGSWKLHLPHAYVTITEPGVDGLPGQAEWRDLGLSLFNLDDDPGETVNLVEQLPDVVNRLWDAAAAFDKEMQKSQRPIGQLCPEGQCEEVRHRAAVGE